MDENKFRERFWIFAVKVAGPVIKKVYNLEVPTLKMDEPFIVIANHANNSDPLFVSLVFPRNPISFVASEHIFRLGIVSKGLEFLVAPIPRKKAASGADTVKACLRGVKAGRNIGLMAEGEATWNGESMPVFSATGKLVKNSGAALVTLRIEGAYLAKPRWAMTRRHGKIKVNIANVYSSEQLKEMSASDILDAINNDIHYNCFENPTAKFEGKDLAAGIERALYLCPRCGHVGCIETSGNKLRCFRCGAKAEIKPNGTFEGTFGFSNILEWDKAQEERIRTLNFIKESDDVLFSDKDVTIRKIISGHDEVVVGEGLTLIQKKDELTCGIYDFKMDSISNMAMTQAKRLLISYDGSYYEIKANDTSSLRKYLILWQNKPSEES